MDVVEFYSCSSTKRMRYHPVAKKFWQIGKKKFHGKFINFMSGYKHLGSLIEKMSLEEENENFDPTTAAINFAVPSIFVPSI